MLATRRPSSEFFVARRHQCLEVPSHRFTTYEVLQSFVLAMGSKNADRIREQCERGVAKDREWFAVRCKVVELHNSGLSLDGIAYTAGIQKTVAANIVRDYKNGYLTSVPRNKARRSGANPVRKSNMLALQPQVDWSCTGGRVDSVAVPEMPDRERRTG